MAKTAKIEKPKQTRRLRIVEPHAAPSNGHAPRLDVLKTYKLYIDGKFPRSESEQSYVAYSESEAPLANVCLASRKDMRNAVSAARKAFGGWAARSAYNRGQILYRMAEMLETRSSQFVAEIQSQGSSLREAKQEVEQAVDRLVYYAGWSDKYQQVFGSINPVSSSHFNFSLPEATGVVAVVAPEDSSLLGLVSTLAPVIVGGNTMIALASFSKPLCAISFAEVLNSSDLPGGVVNILTGNRADLLSHVAKHMDINAMVVCDLDAAQTKQIQLDSVDNLKRVVINKTQDWTAAEARGPYQILELQEIKTTWHPIGV